MIICKIIFLMSQTNGKNIAYYGTLYLFTSANPKHRPTLLWDVHLKTYYFHSAYPAPIAAPVVRPDSLLRFWRYTKLLLTYILTYS